MLSGSRASAIKRHRMLLLLADKRVASVQTNELADTLGR
jgi:hypothetical protein